MKKIIIFVLFLCQLGLFAESISNKQRDCKVVDESLSIELFRAAHRGNVEKLRELIDQGIDLNCKNDDKETALHIAAWEGHYDFIKILLENGADIQAGNYFNLTSLHLAVCRDKIEIVRLLLERGADVNAVDNTGLHVLDYFPWPKMVDLLVDFGARKVIQNDNVQEGLKEAVYFKQIDQVKKFIELGGDVNIIPNRFREGYYTYFLLGRAAQYKESELLNILINAGADVNLYDSQGLTALYWATRSKNLNNVNIMLSAGADFNQSDRRKRRPINAAILNDDIKMVKFYIKKGAPIDDDYIYDASLRDRVEIMKVLLAYRGKERVEKHALYQSVSNNSPEMVRLLIDAGENVNSVHYNKETPLYRAVLVGNTEVVQMLIDAGADPFFKTEYGQTLIQVARYHKHQAIANLLLQYTS